MELPENIQAEIDDLAEQGNDLCDEDQYDEAIEVWRDAMELLPEPRVDWAAYMWLSASIGDAQYLSGQFEAASQSFYDALNGLDGAENPFIHYRLGQCLVKLGDEDRGLQSLLKAYMLDGEDIFDDGDDGEDFLQMLRDRKLIDS